MKKKNKTNKMTSVIVKFYPCTDSEIDKLLKKLNLSGIRVSNLINRWAIDMPYWKEKHYLEKLSESELVEQIYSNPSYSRFSNRNSEELEENE